MFFFKFIEGDLINFWVILEIFHQINSRRILYVLGEFLGVCIEGDLACFWGRPGCVLVKEILHVFGAVLGVF